jgi:hypothetical protein
MRKKQTRLYLGRNRPEVAVVPSGQDVFEQARMASAAIPSHAKAVPIGGPRRLSGRKTLLHQRILLLKEQVFQKNGGSSVGKPTAHGESSRNIEGRLFLVRV